MADVRMVEKLVAAVGCSVISHRASYLKTTCAAFAAATLSFALAGYEIVALKFSLPTVGATSGVWAALHWLAVVVLLALGLLCLLVGTGGLFALHDDARERAGGAPSASSVGAR